MAASKIVSLCDGIVAFLAATPYPYRFNVSRELRKQLKMEDTNETQVFVYPAPGGSSYPAETRDVFGQTYSVYIHIANYLDTNSQEEIDQALDLHERIAASLVNTAFIGDFQFLEFESGDSPVDFFDNAEAQQHNYYHSVISVQYLSEL